MIIRKSLRSKSIKKTLGTYGVAMSSLFVVHDIHAEILDITWNGGENKVVVFPYPGGVCFDNGGS